MNDICKQISSSSSNNNNNIASILPFSFARSLLDPSETDQNSTLHVCSQKIARKRATYSGAAHTHTHTQIY